MTTETRVFELYVDDRLAALARIVLICGRQPVTVESLDYQRAASGAESIATAQVRLRVSGAARGLVLLERLLGAVDEVRTIRLVSEPSLD